MKTCAAILFFVVLALTISGCNNRNTSHESVRLTQVEITAQTELASETVLPSAPVGETFADSNSVTWLVSTAQCGCGGNGHPAVNSRTSLWRLSVPAVGLRSPMRQPADSIMLPNLPPDFALPYGYRVECVPC
ncbi:MAG: hypothetical protein FWE06_07045 [Oscillospiraceae bacterium]|nr:hypothetical protein [Oscillospiraceae bacterium]